MVFQPVADVVILQRVGRLEMGNAACRAPGEKAVLFPRIARRPGTPEGMVTVVQATRLLRNRKPFRRAPGEENAVLGE